MTTLDTLNLDPKITQALKALDWTTLTEIQLKAIPAVLGGKDLIACAQTGTGKTGAYLIPLLSKLIIETEAQALVLAPTRELALQIEKVWLDLTRGIKGMVSACLVGGLSMVNQRRALSAGPALIIATPGRLIDHLESGSLRLQASYLVLDEADRMLDMGFAPQVERILRFMPSDRQTLLFSATWDDKLESVFRGQIKNPERIVIGRRSQAAVNVRQSAQLVQNDDKKNILVQELANRNGTVIVFTRTKHRADRLAKQLSNEGIEAGRIHGDRTQGQRNAVMRAFREGDIRVLVATDVAARGLDVSHIEHVINFDLPAVAEDYVHRIGRTGRAGADGHAISFVAPEEMPLWRDIEKYLAHTKSAKPENIGFDSTSRFAPGPKAAPRQGGGGGGRRSFAGGGYPRSRDDGRPPRSARPHHGARAPGEREGRRRNGEEPRETRSFDGSKPKDRPPAKLNGAHPGKRKKYGRPKGQNAPSSKPRRRD